MEAWIVYAVSYGGEAEENSVREEENELLGCTQTLQVSVVVYCDVQTHF